jgi:4-oxalocrotonate tautomerase
MPHVVVKMMSGRSEEQKKELADKLVLAAISVLGTEEDSLSVAIEDIEPGRWERDVFAPEIKGRKEILYKKPGYASVA